MVRVLITGVALLGLMARAEAHVCAGRFVVRSGAGGPLDESVIVLDDTTVAIDRTCAPAPMRVRRIPRHGWHLAARWSACGSGRRIWLRAWLSADCTLLGGVVRGKSIGRTVFSARPSLCGDGVVDAGAGEGCDDGNTLGADPCDATCVPCDPSTGPLADSWAGVQENVFKRYGCITCHGTAALSGGLDLRPAVALTNLVGVPSSDVPDLLRVRPGDERASVLWLKLAKATLGGFGELPGAGMPFGGRITPAELDAVGAWIRAGAPVESVIPGSELLLERCRPR